ncbi:hypothetical protein ND00_32120 [Clostridium sp. L74]|nr:hypothetical protein ND00_32120 [Clostridium sp. L74]
MKNNVTSKQIMLWTILIIVLWTSFSLIFSKIFKTPITFKNIFYNISSIVFWGGYIVINIILWKVSKR